MISSRPSVLNAAYLLRPTPTFSASASVDGPANIVLPLAAKPPTSSAGKRPIMAIHVSIAIVPVPCVAKRLTRWIQWAASPRSSVIQSAVVDPANARIQSESG